MIRRWIRDWMLIDLLAFGAGATSSVLYILYSSEVSAPYRELWANLSIDMLGVWISVRIIDALIQARGERPGVRNRLLGNLNFMRNIAQRLPPYFDVRPIKDLSDEIRWFKAKRSGAGAKQLAKFFTAEERKGIKAVLARAEEIEEFAEKLLSARAAFRRAADSNWTWDAPQQIQDFIKAVRRLDQGDSKDEAEVRSMLTQVEANLKTGKYAADVAAKTKLPADFDQAMADVMISVNQLVTSRESLPAEIMTLEKELGELRRLIEADN